MKKELEDYFYSLSRFGIKLGLGPTSEFAKQLGNPQDSFKSIHVTGSNGKGSTTTFIYNVIKRKYIAGIYTSPHLRRFNERIIVQDKEIEDSFIENFLEKYKPVIKLNDEEVNLTFFEYTTVMAFEYFRAKGVQYAAIEVGLGGRLDSTNIIKSEAAVITSISLEHADKLGGYIESIAREKAGIIKEGKPVVVNQVPLKAMIEIERVARSKNAPLIKFSNNMISDVEYSLKGTKFKLKYRDYDFNFVLKSLGKHQIQNASMAAISLVESGAVTEKEIIEEGINSTVVPGRMEIRSTNPLIILDGSHNSEAARVLAENIKLYGIKNPTILAAILKDKNSYNVLNNLSTVSDHIIITEPNEEERKKSAEELAAEAKLFFKDVEIIKKPHDAIKSILDRKLDTVITGSMYLVGEAENILDNLLNHSGNSNGTFMS